MFLLRVLCVGAVIVARASAVAPGDEEPLCDELRALGSLPTPDYDPTMRILMDTWNYLNLLPVRTGSVWEQVDNDNNNLGAVTSNWIQNSNNPCRQTVQVCGFFAGAQNNWLITQLINRTVNGTRLSQVSVTIEFEQRDCDVALNCQRTFNTHVYERSSENTEASRNTSNYRQVQRVSPDDTSGNRVNETIAIDFDDNSQETSFYFAVQDETSCIVISRMIAFYNVCPRQTSDLINYPERFAPTSGILASCVENAVTENGGAPIVICSAGGIWSAPSGKGCQCKRGFVNQGGVCTYLATMMPPTATPTAPSENVTIPCPLGTYQLDSQGDCLPCPLNTNTGVENATICPCLSGYFRAASEGPEIDCTQPPSTCRNIRALSVDEQTVNVSWSKPDNTGRDDFYYIVEYSDGESVGSFPVVSEEQVVQYSIGGLRPATDYTITVTVENGVSDQDQQNQYLRRCELMLTTQEGRPSPPIDFQSLCDVIVWGTPFSPNGDITGYEAQFYIPGTQNMKIVEIAKDRTFYIVKENDNLDGDTDPFVRVRAKTRAGTGQWSVGRTLGCDLVIATPPSTVCPPCNCPTCPTMPTAELPTTVAPTSSVYFVLNGQTYNNNSVVSLTDIGEGAGALLCKTNLINCCGKAPYRFGQFYYPNGTMVPVNSIRHEFYRNRGDQEIRLHRRDGAISPTGRFRCEVPDADRVFQNLFITLV